MRRRAGDVLPRLRWVLLLLWSQPVRAPGDLPAPPPSLPPPGGDGRNLGVIALAAFGCALGGALLVFIMVAPILAAGPRPARTTNKREEPCVRVASGSGFTGLDEIRIDGNESPGRGPESVRSSEWSSAGCCARQCNGSSCSVNGADGEEVLYT